MRVSSILKTAVYAIFQAKFQKAIALSIIMTIVPVLATLKVPIDSVGIKINTLDKLRLKSSKSSILTGLIKQLLFYTTLVTLF